MAAQRETVFTYGAPSLKYGAGAADEVGHDVAALGVTRALVVTDRGVAATGGPDRVLASLRTAGVDALLFDGVHVEPTDVSLREATEVARSGGPFDGVVAVGGGSSIDTAKAVALLTSNPGDLLDYVNPPLGGGRAPTQPLPPVVAVPTTTGTGSESTTVCVLDLLDEHVKTGISHSRLRPVLAVVDPDLTVSQPAMVTASAGFDILCHALESWTARPYDSFDRKAPQERVPYCGANPLADLFAQQALTLLGRSFQHAVHDGADRDARGAMALAATFAGLGFGNAGVHVPHALAYPVAGGVRGYHPAGYPDAPLVPHGMAVALTAPAAFRFTFPTSPDRHLAAARLLAGDRPPPAEAEPEMLPAALLALMREVGLPNGLAAVGYGEADVPDLVAGALKQHRLLALAPRPVDADDLAGIVRGSMTLW